MAVCLNMAPSVVGNGHSSSKPRRAAGPGACGVGIWADDTRNLGVAEHFMKSSKGMSLGYWI